MFTSRTESPASEQLYSKTANTNRAPTESWARYRSAEMRSRWSSPGGADGRLAGRLVPRQIISASSVSWEANGLDAVQVLRSHSVVSNSVTPRTIACQVPLSMEFSRQEYWSELPFPTPGDRPDPGIKPMFLEGGNSWVESERINKRRKRRPFQWEWTVWRKLQRPETSH